MSVFAYNNPISIMRSAQSFNTSYSRLGQSIERLASGLEVTSTADDTTKFVTAEYLRSDVATFNQGARNANDAISMMQVADGAIQVIDEKLIRMKELAEQASTGSYDSIQRSIIDSEYQAMASEITRIANATEFNNIKLLNGNLSGDVYNGGFYDDFPGKMKIHYGDLNDRNVDYTFFSIDSLTSSSLGIGNSSTGGGYSISTQEGAQNALVALNEAISSKSMIRAEIGGMQNRLESVVNKLNFASENATASISRLVDVDVADEMTEFTKEQILTQVSGSIITQANVTVKMALDLLK